MDNLTAVLARYPHSERLLDAPSVATGAGPMVAQDRDSVAPPGASIRMFRDVEFDICELPIISYLVAREHGVPLVGLPIFVTRDFDHVKWIRNTERIREPADIEGKRVGVGYFGFTDGTWARGVLSEQYGVDLTKVQWVTNSEEVVAGAAPPEHVECRPGVQLDQLLLDGELDALILTRAGGYRDAPHLGPLFPDLPVAERAWFDATGVFPIHHMITVRSSTVDAHPDLPKALMAVFSEAKAEALASLDAGSALSDEQKVKARFSGFPTRPGLPAGRPYLGRDPLPYGISPNRRAIEMAISLATNQGILRQAVTVEDRFEMIDP